MDARKKSGPPHAWVDGDWYCTQFEKAEHPDNQVVPRFDREQHASASADAVGLKDSGGGITLSVELAEGAERMDDSTIRTNE